MSKLFERISDDEAKQVNDLWRDYARILGKGDSASDSEIRELRGIRLSLKIELDEVYCHIEILRSAKRLEGAALDKLRASIPFLFLESDGEPARFDITAVGPFLSFDAKMPSEKVFGIDRAKVYSAERLERDFGIPAADLRSSGLERLPRSDDYHGAGVRAWAIETRRRRLMGQKKQLGSEIMYVPVALLKLTPEKAYGQADLNAMNADTGTVIGNILSRRGMPLNGKFIMEFAAEKIADNETIQAKITDTDRMLANIEADSKGSAKSATAAA